METKILNWKNKKALKKAKQTIVDGGILVYPTDTIYGFGVDASNKDSINRLNSLKNRKGPISVIAPNNEIVSSWINVPDNEKEIALKELKPYRTIIYPVYEKIVNNLILGPNNTLGIRIPDHPFCKSLSKACNIPITTTSVNRSGELPKINVDEILNSFQNNIDLIIEDGELSGSASSIYLYQAKTMKKIR
tara:strand:- start:1393 stop:1965 length:573 start_codon:yes stop_codon:yes gene_type:complete